MKKFVFIYLLVSIPAFIFSQNVSMMKNLSFEETWTEDIPMELQPDGWKVISGNVEKIKSDDAQHGNYAVYIEPVNDLGTQFGMLIGEDTMTRYPVSISYYMKGSLTGSDFITSTVSIISNGKVIGNGILSLASGDIDTTYQQFTIDINYTQSHQPDSITLVISCIGETSNGGASNMYIDNITFTYGNVNIIKHDKNIENIRIYPNPSNGQIHIETADNTNIRIFNIEGRLVENHININPYSVLNLNVSAGIYFMHIQTGKTTTVHKLIVR